MCHKKFSKNQSGFALIYTLLFVVLLMVTVSATWFTGLANLRLSQRSEYSVQARQLAQAAIDEGWVKYKKLLGRSNPIPDDSTLTFPNNACVSPNPNFYRNYPDTNPIATPTSMPLSPAPSLEDVSKGVYDYKICTAGGATTIEGIGYFKGNKITLKATVTHHDVEIMGPDPANPVNQIRIGWNHDGDTLTIYQAGPSK